MARQETRMTCPNCPFSEEQIRHLKTLANEHQINEIPPELEAELDNIANENGAY